MNIKGGLLRVWVVFTAIFILIVAAFSYENAKSKFDAIKWNKYIELPVYCNKAKGKPAVDFLYSKHNGTLYCLYSIDKFRVLYPEYNDINDSNLVSKIYESANWPIEEKTEQNPWKYLLGVILSMIGIPLLIFIFGYLILWAKEGFM